MPSRFSINRQGENMSKNKIFVCDVLPCAGDLDVVVALVEDGETTREVQICIPKYCDISKCIGEEIYYEIKNGRVRLSAVRSPKHEVDDPTQDIESGEE